MGGIEVIARPGLPAVTIIRFGGLSDYSKDEVRVVRYA